MNLSLIVIEKIKTFFNLPDTQFVSLAGMAPTMDKDDFVFMADIPDEQAGDKDLVDRLYATKYYFAHLANSLPDPGELVWNPDLDPENTLDKKYPDVLENAELNRKNQSFVNKWLQKSRGLELARLTDPVSNNAFLETSCSPAFYDKIEQPWSKFRLDASELASLDQAVKNKYPKNIYENVDPLMNGEKLDIQSLQFEIQLASIQRHWFDRGLLDNRNWKLAGAEMLSNGADSKQGKLPAYPSSLLFIKNVEWELAPGSANNMAALQKIQSGALNLGSLPVQGIPVNANLNQLKNLHSSNLSPRQYVVFNKNIQSRLNKGDLVLKSEVILPFSAAANKTDPSKPAVSIPLKTTNIQSAFKLPPKMNTAIKRGAAGQPVQPPAAKSPVIYREYFRYYPFMVTELRSEPATYSISGTLRARGSNAPVADALVTVLFGEGKRLTATTGQNGEFAIPNVAKGDVTICVAKANFESYEESLLVNGNLTRNVTLGQTAALPAGAFFLFGVVSSRLPRLPNPDPAGDFTTAEEAVEVV